MTYQPPASLFLENGPALAARRIHRLDAYPILFGADPAPQRKAANDEAAIRFAL